MRSETQKRKKIFDRIKSVFRYIFIALLAILLFLSPYFHAPWKIILLLLIFLLACITLPRKFRKWFWIGFGGLVIIYIIWVLLPVDNKGWRTYTFKEDVNAFNQKFAVPEKKNAAPLYDSLFKKLDSESYQKINPDNEGDTFYSLTKKPWSKKQYPEYSAWLKENRPHLEMLLETTEKPVCYFKIQPGFQISDIQMERFSQARHWAWLLAFAANHELAEGLKDQALQKYTAALRLGTHLRKQPGALYKLTGISIQAIGFENLNKFIINHNPTEQNFNFIENVLKKATFDWSKEISQMLDRDELQRKSEIGMFYQVNSEGDIRFIRDTMQHTREQSKTILKSKYINYAPELKESYENIAYPSFLQKKLCKAYTILLWLTAPSDPEKAGDMIEKYINKQKQKWTNTKTVPEEPPKSFNAYLTPFSFGLAGLNFEYLIKMQAQMAEGSYYRFIELTKRISADKAGTHLLIAIKKFETKNNKLPDTLDAISHLCDKKYFTDPITNEPFIYRKTENGFELYSKGPNKIDEGGEYESTSGCVGSEHKIIHDDRKIWPRK